MEKSFKMVCKTMMGLENVLAKELEDIGAQDIKVLRRAVEFTGDLKIMYMANYWLRTALSVLKPIATFPVHDKDELYDNIKAIDWLKIFDIGKTFSISSVSFNSNLDHTQYISLRAKDAIADYFRYKFNQRPDVEKVNPNIRIHLYLNNNICEVALDSSGDALFKRGYRTRVNEAPISEVLAAGMIKLSGWDGQTTFIDPMCGSGTLAIEAAMIALNLPSGYFRKDFSFQHWSDFEPIIWKEVVAESEKQINWNNEVEIIASDISERAVAVAIENIKNAKLHKDIKVVQSDISDIIPSEDVGIVMINPPYGERIKSDDLVGLYKKIGDAFKKNFTGYKAWVISSDIKTLKLLGLRTSSTTELQNGPLYCKFCSYDLYEGSKKLSKNIDFQEN